MLSELVNATRVGHSDLWKHLTPNTVGGARKESNLVKILSKLSLESHARANQNKKRGKHVKS